MIVPTNTHSAACSYDATPIISSASKVLSNTINSLYDEQWTYKEVKFLCKTTNSIFKLSGFKNAALVASFIKNFARLEGLYEFVSEGSLGYQSVVSTFNQEDFNKKYRELAKKSWVIFTFLDHISVIAYAGGAITEQSLLAIALAQQISKCAKQSLSILHSMMLWIKAKNKPESPKVVLWNFCFTRGLLKSVILTLKIAGSGKALSQFTSFGVGAMSLVKRRHFVPEKKRLKLAQKAQLKVHTSELSPVVASSSQKNNQLQRFLVTFRVLIFLLLITETFLAHHINSNVDVK